MSLSGECLNVPRKGIIRFVAMQIDAQAALGGKRAEEAHGFRALGHRALEMRDAAYDLDTHRDGASEIFKGSRTSQQPVLRKRDELEVEIGSDSSLDLEQRLDGEQAVVAH